MLRVDKMGMWAFYYDEVCEINIYKIVSVLFHDTGLWSTTLICMNDWES